MLLTNGTPIATDAGNGGETAPGPQVVATGWPTAADLAARLGLSPTDDAGRVANANDAAAADAVRILGGDASFDPVAGPDDASQFEAVLLMAQWQYENRNRPEGLDSLNAMATPYYRKVAFGMITKGRIAGGVTVHAAVDEVTAALRAAGLRVAERDGDITPPVVYIQINTTGDAGVPLVGGTMSGLYVYFIPIRGIDNLYGEADGLDAIRGALVPLAWADLQSARSSLTIKNDTWQCHRFDMTLCAVDQPAAVLERIT